MQVEPGAPALRPDETELARGLARFLSEDVIPALDDRALRRGLKETAALIETLALRGRLEPALREWRTAAEARLRGRLEQAGLAWTGLEEAAAEVEGHDELAALRSAVRQHLLEDLALTRRLIAPLHELYSR